MKNRPDAELPGPKPLVEAELGPEQQELWGLPQWQSQLQPLHLQGVQALAGTGANMAEAYPQCGPQQSVT